jgi:serine/threonine protein kinase/tetratricopeptide (TPR) repeat protein
MAADPQRLKELFLTAVELPSPAERAALLDCECGADAELRRRVEALLRAHDDSAGILAQAASGPGPTADLAPPEPEVVGTCVGPYRLLQKLGEGGMGAVWVAEQSEPVRRRVALKVIKPGMDSAQVVRRFAAERQALALMDHTNIARVFDAGTTAAGRPYFVMELVHGVPITKYCDELNLSVRERLELFVPVCQAVQHAHTKGVIHRDLKPSNVLVCLEDGKPVPKVIDFGLAKALHQPLAEGTFYTEFGAVVGTLEYMSPEQAEVSPLGVDTRTDVYALGVLLYELLTGTTPLNRKRLREAALAEVVRLIKEEEPPRPSTRLSESREALASVAARRRSDPRKLTKEVRGELDWIAMRCLEKDRTRRYETASGLARDVERYLADEPVEACPPSAGYRLRKFARKHRGALAAAAACALLLLAGAAVSTWQAVRATRAEQDAKDLAAREEQQRKKADRRHGEALAAVAAERKSRKAEAAQRRRAEKAEREVRKRLVEVTREQQRADREMKLARAISDLLRKDMLLQADSRAQVEGGFVAEPNLTVKEALDRAAKKIGDRFKDHPLEEAAVRQAIGEGYNGIGAAKRAIPHLQRAWDLRKEHLNPDRLSTLDILNTLDIVAKLAGAYRDTGQVDKALPLFRRVLEEDRKNLGPDDPLTLADMGNLAQALQEAGQLDEALLLYEQAMAKHIKQPRPDPRVAVPTLISLALAYLEAGRLKEAVSLSRQALDLATKIRGADHPHTLSAMNNLGLAYLRAGELNNALPLLKETLRKFEQRMGPDHPGTLSTLHNLAQVYVDLGQPDRAVPLHVRALEGRKAKLGPKHRRTLESMVDLASAYQAAGQVPRALPLLVDAVAKCKETLGLDHSQTLGSMSNLAVAYRQSGRPDKAVPLLEQVLAKMKVKSPDHPHTLVAMNNLAMAYRFTHRPKEAVHLLEEALLKMKAKWGPHHAYTLGARRHLADAYQEDGQLDRAEPLYREFLEQARKQPGPDHPYTAGLMDQLGLNLLRQKKHADAEPLLRECLDIRAKKQPDGWLTFNTKSMLGGALLGQKKFAEAEPLLKDGYEGMKQRAAVIPPEGKARLAEALERLVRLYEATGKMEEAARWRKELPAPQAREPKSAEKRP